MFVPIGGMIGTGHDDALDARVVDAAIDVVGHLNVFVLGGKTIDVGDIAPVNSSRARPLVREMYDRILPGEVLFIPRAFSIDEVDDLDAIDPIAVAVGVDRINQRQIVSDPDTP